MKLTLDLDPTETAAVLAAGKDALSMADDARTLLVTPLVNRLRAQRTEALAEKLAALSDADRDAIEQSITAKTPPPPVDVDVGK